MEYNKLSDEIITKLQALVGVQNVVTDAGQMEIYAHDEVTDPAYHHMPEAVVFAENTQQVAAVVKLANEYHFPVVPRGAGTGLACGAVPIYGGVVLSLEKMNKIIEVNADAMYAVVEPGVRTSDLQAAAAAKGAFMRATPAAVIPALSAAMLQQMPGGNRAVKYGTTRHQVYAVEVVNPIGKIVQQGARLQKQTTGYCLEQLIIGSEGTLGIITQITVKLLPLPKYSMDLLAVFESPEDAIGTVNKLIMAGIMPTCVEYMDNITIKSVERYLGTTLQGSDKGNYLIVEVEGTSEDDLDEKACTMDEICSENGAGDVLVAEHDKIWQARKAFAEAVRAESLIVCKEDVVCPVDHEPALLAEILRLADKYQLVTRIASHAGDGNIHLNILKQEQEDYADWDARVKANQQELYRFIYAHGGRLSGEHGIGYKRKQLMEEFTNPDELEMMRAIKKALDPNNILNPGKIFDIE